MAENASKRSFLFHSSLMQDPESLKDKRVLGGFPKQILRFHTELLVPILLREQCFFRADVSRVNALAQIITVRVCT